MAMPKPQSYPVSKIKVSAVLYSCIAWTEMGKTSTEIEQWIVRSIQARRGTKSRMGFPVHGATEKPTFVNLTQKVDRVTWGKRSSRTGDFGWRKSIPSLYKRQFEIGDKLPSGIYTTVRAALVYGIADAVETIAWYKAKIGTETDADGLVELEGELIEFEAQQAALKRRLAMLDNPRTKDKPKAAIAA